jgi:hypothetical protein
MNLFILSLIPAEIAESMMDKHISKILLEAVQMLCTAKRILDPEESETDTTSPQESPSYSLVPHISRQFCLDIGCH